MKLILELKENLSLKNGDLLIYENGFFTRTTKSSLLKETEKDISDLCAVISKLEQRINLIETELKYNRGEISKEEYELCLGTK